MAGPDSEVKSNDFDTQQSKLQSQLEKGALVVGDINEQHSLDASTENNWITGWRLHLLSLGVALCMFLVNIEVTIIGTSLVTIVNDLNGFSKQGWVVTGYLLTYTSMLIIWTKASDIFGRKPAVIIAMFLFTVFSGGCGAAQTMNQLIICRTFQGIGAAGGVAMSLVICYEMVPRHKYPVIAAQVAGATTLGALTGPLIGGGISEYSTWRWVFLINVPGGIATLIILIVAIPSNFPHQGKSGYVTVTCWQRLSQPSLARLDVSGALLLLGATLLLVAVLLEAGSSFAWNSATSIACLVISGIMWILFLFNEMILTNDKYKQEPIFPWRFLFNRPWMGLLFVSLLSGLPYILITINLPQRFQAVYAVSPLDAGVRLLPFNGLVAFFSAATPGIIGKIGIPPILVLFIGSALQLVGIILFSTLPINMTKSIPGMNYGYEVLTATGIGMCFGMSLVMPPFLVEKRDLAISGGALLQFRVLGGAIGLSIATSVMNNYLTNHLREVLNHRQLSSILKSMAEVTNFAPAVQELVLSTFLDGYNLQMRIMIAFSSLQLLLVFMLWKKQILIRD